MVRKIFFIISISFLFFSKSFCKEYKRIICLAPSITESLYELGLESSVKGITLHTKKIYKDKEIIGNLLEQDIEKIISLKPDLIIATKDGNIQKAVDVLRQYNYVGFDIYVMESAKNFDDICTNFLKLAEKLEKSDYARNIVKQAKKSVQKIYNKITAEKDLKLFWQIGAIPILYTAGNQSFINSYNHYTKTKNLYEDINLRYLSVDVENVLERNPDIIIIVNMGYLGAKEKKYWGKYKVLNAVKSNRVFVLNEEDLLMLTPLTFAKSVKSLVKIIYEDIQK
ncbi:MAG: helical backbone metal receptor [Endomicrobium sp.]|jgi:iron complex transport system substrate-binding protein|nr:helical backbone metal receptor [Endomicrobium sp.]